MLIFIKCCTAIQRFKNIKGSMALISLKKRSERKFEPGLLRDARRLTLSTHAFAIKNLHLHFKIAKNLICNTMFT